MKKEIKISLIESIYAFVSGHPFVALFSLFSPAMYDRPESKFNVLFQTVVSLDEAKSIFNFAYYFLFL